MTSTKDWTGNSVAFMKTAGWQQRSQQEREIHDYYATEPKAAEFLLQLDDFDDIWECACGGGHLAEVFLRGGKLAMATDKYDQGYSFEADGLVDFLEYEGEWGGDIVTNPPYKYAGQFIEKAMSILEDGHKLALFLPIRYLASRARKAIFTKYPPYKVWVASSRLLCAINGDFESTKGKGSAVDYAWFIWHKGYKGETKLGWFN